MNVSEWHKKQNAKSHISQRIQAYRSLCRAHFLRFHLRPTPFPVGPIGPIRPIWAYAGPTRFPNAAHIGCRMAQSHVELRSQSRNSSHLWGCKNSNNSEQHRNNIGSDQLRTHSSHLTIEINWVRLTSHKSTWSGMNQQKTEKGYFFWLSNISKQGMPLTHEFVERFSCCGVYPTGAYQNLWIIFDKFW